MQAKIVIWMISSGQWGGEDSAIKDWNRSLS